MIKHKVCLNSVRKLVRGVQGKNAPTGVTELKSWRAFEEEVSYIWRNCREYNEDDSDIAGLAGEFEVSNVLFHLFTSKVTDGSQEHFKEMLAEAKAVVDDPPQPSIKLKLGASTSTPSAPSIKLRLNAGSKPSPGPSGTATPSRNSATPGVIVDGEALARQRLHVDAGMHGRPSSASAQPGAASRNPFSHSNSATPIPTISQHTAQRAPSGGAGSPPLTKGVNGVKSEAPAASPAMNGVRPISAAGDRQSIQPAQSHTPQLAPAPMLPPGSTLRPPSASPLPPNPYGPISQQMHQPHAYHHAPSSNYAQPQLTGVENKYRAAGKSKFPIYCARLMYHVIFK